jgi:hypothetical protein
MGTPLAAEVLVSHAAVEDESVRMAIQAALARLIRVSNMRVDAARLGSLLESELAAGERWKSIRRDLASLSAGTLLDESLRTRYERAVERAFHLLAAMRPKAGATILRVHATWRDGDGDHRAKALALLGNLVGGDPTERVLDLVDAGRPAKGAPVLADVRIDELLWGTDDWLRVCALWLVGEWGLATHHETVRQIAVEEVAEIVRDTANLALERMHGAEPGRRRNTPVPIHRMPTPVPLGGGGRVPMFSTVEKVLYLKGISLFSEIPAEELVGIAAIARPLWYDAGIRIFEKGDDGDSLYLIMFGEASVLAGDRELARLGPGEVFGEMALLDADPRSAAVTATTNLNVLRIGRDDFHDLIDERPDVLRGIVKVLTRRLRNVANA